MEGKLDIELDREARIAARIKVMNELGLMKQKSILESFGPVKKAAKKPRGLKPSFPKQQSAYWKVNPRRSGRLSGAETNYMEIDEHDQAIAGKQPPSRPPAALYEENLVDLMDRKNYQPDANVEPSAEALQAIQDARCASQGRGGVYDSRVGITCHFCRQKKLCGEEDCPRCSKLNANEECIGKSMCTKCHSLTGRFCRACLLIRYGQKLEDVLQDDTWLCPHCYEEEHPCEGWICNSSICMKRRGLAPTGIAIYDAHQRGFKSVGHLLQAKLKARGATAVLEAAARGEALPDQEPVPVAADSQASDNTAVVPDDLDVPLRNRATRGRRPQPTTTTEAEFVAPVAEPTAQTAAEPAKIGRTRLARTAAATVAASPAPTPAVELKPAATSAVPAETAPAADGPKRATRSSARNK